MSVQLNQKIVIPARTDDRIIDDARYLAKEKPNKSERILDIEIAGRGYSIVANYQSGADNKYLVNFYSMRRTPRLTEDQAQVLHDYVSQIINNRGRR